MCQENMEKSGEAYEMKVNGEVWKYGRDPQSLTQIRGLCTYMY
jgi:hypothetical protein